MSSEFENFNASQFESDDQLCLRERFESVGERNALEILMFDPTEPETARRIRTTSGEREIEKSEPALTKLLKLQMLRDIQLEIPQRRDDPRLITDRYFTNGAMVAIFTVTRKDESYIPVYYETTTDGVTPRLVYLMSFDRAEETVLNYRNIDEYRTRLSRRLNVGDAALLGLEVEDLKGLDATLDDIRRL